MCSKPSLNGYDSSEVVFVERTAFILCDDWFLVKGALDLYTAPAFVGLGWETPRSAACQTLSGPRIPHIDLRRSIRRMMDVGRHLTAEA